MDTPHPQETIRHRGREAEMDKDLAPLILELWRAGWWTTNSCQEHPPTGMVWVEFERPMFALGFLDAVVPFNPETGSLWSRVESWTFEMIEPASGPRGTRHGSEGMWQYHIRLSVLFPPSDLSLVTKRMQERKRV